MTPSPIRNIVLKASLNADEFIPFRDKCAAAGVAVSARIRTLISRDVRQQPNDIRGTRKRERPSLGPVRVLFPCRHGQSVGARVSRLRL